MKVKTCTHSIKGRDLLERSEAIRKAISALNLNCTGEELVIALQFLAGYMAGRHKMVIDGQGSVRENAHAMLIGYQQYEKAKSLQLEPSLERQS